MKTLKMNLFVLLVMVAYTMVKADTRSPSSSGANQDDVENGQEGGGNSKITNQVGEGLSGGATDASASKIVQTFFNTNFRRIKFPHWRPKPNHPPSGPKPSWIHKPTIKPTIKPTKDPKVPGVIGLIPGLIPGVIPFIPGFGGDSGNDGVNEYDVKLWRDDRRCGTGWNLDDGATPAQCNPSPSDPSITDGDGPCCSNMGWCGNSEAHCKCSGCEDYSIEVPHW